MRTFLRWLFSLRNRLVFAPPPQVINLFSLPIDLTLLSTNLLILPIGLVLLALHLIADHSASAKAESAANCRAGSRVTNRRANETACSGTPKRADTGAFFSRR